MTIDRLREIWKNFGKIIHLTDLADVYASGVKAHMVAVHQQFSAGTGVGDMYDDRRGKGEGRKGLAGAPARTLRGLDKGAEEARGRDSRPVAPSVPAWATLPILFGTIRSQGRAMTQDLNQFAGRGIPIYTALAKVLGTNEAGVRKLAETGQVSFGHIQKAFQEMTGAGGQFAGLMERQSKTTAGLFSTLKGNVDIDKVKINIGLCRRESGH